MATSSATRKATAIAVPGSEAFRRERDARLSASQASSSAGQASSSAGQEIGISTDAAAANMATAPSSARRPEPRPLPRRLTPGSSAGPSRMRFSSVSSNSTGTGASRSQAANSGTQSYASASAASLRRPGTLDSGTHSLRQSIPSWRATPIPPSVISGRRKEAQPEQAAESSARGAAAKEADDVRQSSVAPHRAASVTSSTPRAGRTIGKPPRGSRPKAPPSAYVLFSQQRRGDVERNAATASGPRFNVNAAVRKAWEELDEQTRSTFEAESAQRRTEHQAAMEAFREIYGDGPPSSGGEGDDRLRGRKGAKRIYRPGEPVPPKNAYFLFKQQYEQQTTDRSKSSASISQAWHALEESERAEYKAQADEARRTYEAARVAWRQENADGDTGERSITGQEDREAPLAKRRKKPSVSDDEADYLVQFVQHGSAHRLDERATAMSQLSELDFKHGRASAKTFDMERKLRQEKRNRDNVRRQMRRQNVNAEADLVGFGTQALAPAAVPSHASDVDATTDGGNTSATDGDEDDDDDDGSDAESIGAASASTHHTLRDRKFSIRTRIVDGKIVVDESSLLQSRNEDAGWVRRGETIDINEGDRFVNSATYAKPRLRNDRWTTEETTRFLDAVSMWGSDFEMITRMFPLRSRQQIRAKWRSMERTDSHSLDLAFKRRLPVDLDAYGRLAGVDLSGEGPQIEAMQQRLSVKKAEEEAEADAVVGADEELVVDVPKEVERDENGLEIVDEGDAQDVAPPARGAATRAGKQAHRRSANVQDADSMPAPPRPIRHGASHAGLRATSAQPPTLLNSTTTPRLGRSGSRARSGSTTSLAGSTSQSVASTSAHASASDRERKQRQEREESRKERERARRRPAPSGDEEIVE